MVNGMYQQMYCSFLEGTDWYLVAIMPYGLLTDSVMTLADMRQVVFPLLRGYCADTVKRIILSPLASVPLVIFFSL